MAAGRGGRPGRYGGAAAGVTGTLDRWRGGAGRLVKIWYILDFSKIFINITPHPIDSRKENDIMKAFRLNSGENLI